MINMNMRFFNLDAFSTHPIPAWCKKLVFKVRWTLVGFLALPLISKWINEKDGLWKTERHNAVINVKHQGDNLKEIIKMLADDKLEILKQIDEATQQGDREKELELRKQAASLDNSVNAWGKQLAEMNKKNAITLSIYLEVMTRIFDAMSVQYPDIYYKTLDFQEQHAYEVAKTLG